MKIKTEQQFRIFLRSKKIDPKDYLLETYPYEYDLIKKQYEDAIDYLLETDPSNIQTKMAILLVLKSDNLSIFKKIYKEDIISPKDLITGENCGPKIGVYLLKEYNLDPNLQDGYLLTSACVHGNIKLVKSLLKLGADPKLNDSWALVHAVKSKNIDIVRLILEAGADISTKNGLAMKTAKRLELKSIINLLEIYESNKTVLVAEVEDGEVKWNKKYPLS